MGEIGTLATELAGQLGQALVERWARAPVVATLLIGDDDLAERWIGADGSVSEVAVPDVAVSIRWESEEDAIAVHQGRVPVAGPVHAGRCFVESSDDVAVNEVIAAFRWLAGDGEVAFTPFASRSAPFSDHDLELFLKERGVAAVLRDQCAAQAFAYTSCNLVGETGAGRGRWAVGDHSCDVVTAEGGCYPTELDDEAPGITLRVMDPLAWVRYLGNQKEFVDLFVEEAVAIEGDLSVLEAIARLLPHLR